ncbi:MAG: lipoyl(octanoyl) transferase LipB [Bdellovibrionales bacterium]|nr:lipoyl(octanoyl) transferase LipB [Bdellovibrionales bacterium]
MLSNEFRSIKVLDLGLADYEKTRSLQKEIQQKLINHTGEETLILCSHPAVITLGTSSRSENILLTEDQLKEKNVKLIPIERGGDVTYHGPGQLVVYPLIDLRKRKRDVGWYMRCLEEVIITSLASLDIKGHRISGKTGVWTYPPENASFYEPRKIAAIGVRLSRWCTLHGFSINVRKATKEGMAMIKPCGFLASETTSIEEDLEFKQEKNLDFIEIEAKLKQLIISNFTKIFEVDAATNFSQEIFSG